MFHLGMEVRLHGRKYVRMFAVKEIVSVCKCKSQDKTLHQQFVNELYSYINLHHHLYQEANFIDNIVDFFNFFLTIFRTSTDRITIPFPTSVNSMIAVTILSMEETFSALELNLMMANSRQLL